MDGVENVSSNEAVSIAVETCPFAEQLLLSRPFPSKGFTWYNMLNEPWFEGDQERSGRGLIEVLWLLLPKGIVKDDEKLRSE
jgi:hypothetical protein